MLQGNLAQFPTSFFHRDAERDAFTGVPFLLSRFCYDHDRTERTVKNRGKANEKERSVL
nr:MAG TPA: hypothetical protein [Siphoviridae sp. ct5YG1]